jgi:tetratricopeptide (TPR) repeat protein
MKKLIIFIILLFAFISGTFAAQDVNELFKKANRSYMKEHFKDAALKYQDIIQEGFVSSNVYYNLGNCYFRMKDYGKAILFFERAKRLDPSNESINLNLKIANLKIVDKIKPLPEFFIFSIIKKLAIGQSADTYSYIGVSFIWIGLLLVVALFMNNKISIKKLAFAGAIVCLIMVVSSFYLAHESNKYLKKTNEGIVLAPSVYVKSSPDTESLDAFILHEGTKFTILDNLSSWTKIKIANGNIGWIDKSVFQKI